MYKLLLLIIAARSANSSTEEDFESFTRRYGKTYPNPEERARRYEIFKKNVEMIEAVNNDPNSQETLRLNGFADMTKEEFQRQFQYGYVPRFAPEAPMKSEPWSEIRISDLPKEVDWRNVMTPAKQQGSCGACWAYSSTAVIETHAYLNSNRTGLVPVLSAAMMTNCAPNPLNCGGSGQCGGAQPMVGFAYTNLIGLAKNEDYPDDDSATKCSYNASTKIAVSISGYNVLPSNQIEPLMAYLAFKGPVTVLVNPDYWSQFNDGRSLLKCPSFNEDIVLHHVVALVGYGSDDEKGDYWIIRNSYGAEWGDEGYGYLKRDTACGVDTSYFFCDGQKNRNVTVCGSCGLLYEAVHPIGTYYV